LPERQTINPNQALSIPCPSIRSAAISGAALHHPPANEVITRTPALLACALLLGAFSSAEAQAGTPPMVAAIEIRRQGVFDSAEASNWLFRAVNRLHYQTRESVIRPELLFRQGAPFDSAAMAESMRNLRALGLFRNVEIATVPTDSGMVARLTTSDAWTTSLGFDFASTGGQSSYNVQFLETNFLGTGSRVLARYGKYPDYTATEFEFSHPRLIANRIGIDLYHETRSDGNQSIVVLDHPFRSLASPFGISLTAREFDGRVLRFIGGFPVAIDTLQNRTAQFLLQGAKAIRADANGYLRVGLIAQVLRNDYLPESSTDPFPHHVIFTAGPTLSVSRANFKTTTNYEHLHQTEDLDLSTTLSIGALVVTKAGGNPHNGIAPFGQLRVGKEIPDGFGILAGQASGLFSPAGLDSGSAVLGGTMIFRLGGTHQRLLLHTEGGMSLNAAPVDQFDLGFGLGPRAFGAHAFTGDRYHYSTAEYRYTIAPELASVAGVGLAVFADYGGAWFKGSTPRSGSDIGVGLRIGPTRQADLRTVRIDLAHRFANDVLGDGWVLVVGKGFTFTIAQ
jgi:hypothetical protein